MVVNYGGYSAAVDGTLPNTAVPHVDGIVFSINLESHPKVCIGQGSACGTTTNGCGGTMDCGGCDAPQTCGGGGTANVCGCSTPGCAPSVQFCGGQQMDTSNPCVNVSCDQSTGTQTRTNVADGASCSDANVCNGFERCFSGNCIEGVPPIVDDGDPCTVDTCTSDLGVQHTTSVACAANACFVPPNGGAAETDSQLASAFVQPNHDHLEALKTNLQTSCATCASVLP
jgi:hypothetical protein